LSPSFSFPTGTSIPLAHWWLWWILAWNTYMEIASWWGLIFIIWPQEVQMPGPMLHELIVFGSQVNEQWHEDHERTFSSGFIKRQSFGTPMTVDPWGLIRDPASRLDVLSHWSRMRRCITYPRNERSW
jgi:hypothetical protein